jgi:hypothetical protein
LESTIALVKILFIKPADARNGSTQAEAGRKSIRMAYLWLSKANWPPAQLEGFFSRHLPLWAENTGLIPAGP